MKECRGSERATFRPFFVLFSILFAAKFKGKTLLDALNELDICLLDFVDKSSHENKEQLKQLINMYILSVSSIVQTLLKLE